MNDIEQQNDRGAEYVKRQYGGAGAHLSDQQLARVEALQNAAPLLRSGSPFSKGAISNPYDLMRLAHYILREVDLLEVENAVRDGDS